MKTLVRLSCLLFALSIAPLANADISQNPQVQKFIQRMVKDHNFNADKLEKLFKQTNFDNDIISRISKPFEAKPWYIYRSHFVTDSRIAAGVKFWRGHQKILATVQQRYGVPANIIVALVGVETRYGNNLGKYRVLDSLSTLAFKYPKRSKYFSRELVQFLLMVREDKLDPLTIYGSYAGAMGQPQFMPNSYRHYAVTYSGQGRPNLNSNEADVVASIANYFKEHGWQTGGPVATPATVRGKAFKGLHFNNKPRYSYRILKRTGIKADTPVNNKARVTLLTLRGPKHPEYWLGFNNFYVITRYNTSKLYAMAVYQLSQRIQQAYDKAQARTNTIENQTPAVNV